MTRPAIAALSSRQLCRTSRGRPAAGRHWPDAIPPLRRVVRAARAARRVLLACCGRCWPRPCRRVLLLLPGRAKVGFARLYWAVFSRLIGLQVRTLGVAPANRQGRRVIYAANHCSWLDIPVLGGRLEACFVSKDEIARWPGVSLVARLGRTVFVTRQRGATGRERDDMRGRLAAGDDLLLFPEGTSSDGGRVLPFRSAFFSVAEHRRGRGAAAGAAGLRRLRPARRPADPAQHPRRCSPGTATWTWRAISGAWRSGAACGSLY